jgi:hypothetical protein
VKAVGDEALFIAPGLRVSARFSGVVQELVYGVDPDGYRPDPAVDVDWWNADCWCSSICDPGSVCGPAPYDGLRCDIIGDGGWLLYGVPGCCGGIFGDGCWLGERYPGEIGGVPVSTLRWKS